MSSAMGCHAATRAIFETVAADGQANCVAWTKKPALEVSRCEWHTLCKAPCSYPTLYMVTCACCTQLIAMSSWTPRTSFALATSEGMAMRATAAGLATSDVGNQPCPRRIRERMKLVAVCSSSRGPGARVEEVQARESLQLSLSTYGPAPPCLPPLITTTLPESRHQSPLCTRPSAPVLLRFCSIRGPSNISSHAFWV